MANEKLRCYAKSKGVALWQIAKELNISEATMTRKLRTEISSIESKTIKDVINKIAKENS